MNESKKMILYLVLTFATAWALQAVTIYAQNAQLSTVLLSVSMFAPLLAVIIISGGISQAKTGIGWRPSLRGHLRDYLFAWFGPFLFSVAGAALYFAIFPDQFDPALGFFTVQIPSSTQLPMSSQALLALQILLAFTAAPFFNMIFALGEEAGWRGFMTPRLCDKLGNTKGLLLSGLIWAVWHWPLILFAGYEYGTGYAGAPFTGIAAMCLFTFAFGTALSWVYDRTGSIWAPALMHGAANATAGLGLYFTPAGTTHYLLGPTLAGVVSVLPLALFACLTLKKSSKDSKSSCS
jgi:membrane protease YdiL (CAAX protease family)